MFADDGRATPRPALEEYLETLLTAVEDGRGSLGELAESADEARSALTGLAELSNPNQRVDPFTREFNGSWQVGAMLSWSPNDFFVADKRASRVKADRSVTESDIRLLELALAAGADPHARDSYDGTGLIRAAHRGHARVIGRLLQAGVDVDHVNRLGWTALLEAVILGDGSPRHVETVRQLLDGGADPRLADRDGVTPLVHAERSGQIAVADLLRAAEEGG